MTTHIFYPAGTTVVLHEGSPPVDQSSEVAALTSQVSALTAERDAAASALTSVTAERDLLLAKIEAAKIEADQAVAESLEARGALE